VAYTVDGGAGPGWGGFVGHIDAAMVRAALFSPGGPPARAAALLCGPPPMLKYACRPALREVGFEDGDVVEF
jgi:NAD(P)H-flavin reductase